MLKRRWFWIGLVALLLMAAGIFAMQKKKPVPTPATASPQTLQALEFLPSDLAEVRPQDLRQTLLLTGALRAVNQASVKARVAGEVQEVLVREGEAVKAGQVLIKMDVREYEARAAQSRGALLAARGQLDIAAKARDNNRALLEKNFISKNAFDNAESQYEIARANVESARAALDVAQKSLGDTVVRAPISGLISSRSVQPGEKVSADNRLLDVVDLRTLELEGAVPASEILGVALGQEVQVSFAGLDAPVIGKVARINPATQAGSRSILIYVQLDNPQGQLKAGMFGEARLTLARRDGVLTIPESAVRKEGDSHYVYAVENRVVAKKPFKPGMRGSVNGDAAVEVLEGLPAGARIVRANMGELKPGTPVRLTELNDRAGNGGNSSSATPAAGGPAAR